ncbi:MAG: hypothetical protein HY685_06910, partial [Chloroflexi bacterium]|nr:hypothetical protein [Chloroflexota bacterium]
MDAVAQGALRRIQPFDQDTGGRRLAAAAAMLAILAGILHLYIAPQHMNHLGHGLFLGLTGVAQVAWGIAFWRKPSSALLYGVGIIGAGALIALWAITRVLPAPFGHGGPGGVEAYGILSVVAEGLGLAVLLAMVFWEVPSQEAPGPTRRTFSALLLMSGISALVLYGGGLAAQQVLPWLGDKDEPSLEQFLLPPSAPVVSAPSASSASEAAPSAPSAPEAAPSAARVQELLPVKDLARALARGVIGPGLIHLDVTYMPPLLAQAAPEELFQVPLAQPVAIFMMEEADHDHEVGMSPDPPRPLMRLDGGKGVEAYEITVISQDAYHRRARYLFPLPQDTDPELLYQEQHTLTVLVPWGSGEISTFSWQLPLQLTRAVAQPTAAGLPTTAAQSPAAGLPTTAAQSPSFLEPSELLTSPLSRGLTRTSTSVNAKGEQDITVRATYATPEYWAATLPADAAARYQPDRFIVITLAETSHTSDLPAEPVALSVRLDGKEYQADLVEQVVSSPHHRFTLLRFAVEPPSGLRHRFMEVQLPGSESLEWHFPLIYAGAGAGSGVTLGWGSVLALLGGLVAAMWPCLFQLTAFFIPAMAGISMQEASRQVAAVRRFQAVKAAVFFVVGFTVVYTIAGALIGFTAERLGNNPGFAVWQR